MAGNFTGHTLCNNGYFWEEITFTLHLYFAYFLVLFETDKLTRTMAVKCSQIVLFFDNKVGYPRQIPNSRKNQTENTDPIRNLRQTPNPVKNIVNVYGCLKMRHTFVVFLTCNPLF